MPVLMSIRNAIECADFHKVLMVSIKAALEFLAFLIQWIDESVFIF